MECQCGEKIWDYVRAYDGLTMIVFPVNKAGAIFPIVSNRGKFHGTIAGSLDSYERRIAGAV